MKIKDPLDVRIEPDRLSVRGIIYERGISEKGGVLHELARRFQCTESNIRTHVLILHKKHGFGVKTEKGGRFWIFGEPTLDWTAQVLAEMNGGRRHSLNQDEGVHDESIADPFVNNLVPMDVPEVPIGVSMDEDSNLNNREI